MISWSAIRGNSGPVCLIRGRPGVDLVRLLADLDWSVSA